MQQLKNKLVSVVIPVYNEERDIGACLRSLCEQSYNKIEIVVVDDGSTDKTSEIAKGFKNVKLISGEHKGTGFSRNLGVRKAKGSVLIFVDADMTFDKDYIKNLIGPIFSDETYGTAHSLEYAVNVDNKWARCWGKMRINKNIKEQAIFRAIRKDVFLEKGGFDPKFGYADDQTFYFKFGMKSLTVPSAICYHRNPDSPKEIFKQSRWIGASLFWKYRIFNNKIFSWIFLIVFAVLILPLCIILTIKKLVLFRDFPLIFYYPVFFFYRLAGTLNGFYNWAIKGVNIR